MDYLGRHADLLLSHNGSVVEFAYNTLNSENRWTYHLARIYVAEGRLLVDPPADGEPGPALQTALGIVDLTPPRTDGLPIEEWNSFKPTLGGTPLPLEPYELSRALAIAPDRRRFLLGTEWSLRLFDRQGQQLWRVPVPIATRAVNLSGDGRVAVAAFADGMLRWYRLHDGAELLALFLQANSSRWVLWTPEGVLHRVPWR